MNRHPDEMPVALKFLFGIDFYRRRNLNLFDIFVTHKQYTERHKTNNTQNNTKILEECGPCPVFASYTLAFALQLGKEHGKTSVRVEKPQSG
jgi:hypothetical protein